jgi:hypothetical protein
LANTEALLLNSTAAKYTGITAFDSTTPTSTVFTVAGEGSVNASGESYVAYLFAHDAGGFGLTGTDNVISCGSYTGNGSDSGPTINLGYEPQWVLIKGAVGDSYNWMMFDTMRGLPTGGVDARLFANATSTENSGTDYLNVNSTGFQITGNWQGTNTSGATYIYIAIRKGPMKVPTDATKVFAPFTTTATGSPITVTTNFPVDLTFFRIASSASTPFVIDRLRGINTSSSSYLATSSTAAESTASGLSADSNVSMTDGFLSAYSGKKVYWNFQRAPSFFDEVCYTGTGSTRTLSHNLQAVPELMIIKKRSAAEVWCVYNATIGPTKSLVLNATSKEQNGAGAARFNDTAPTSSVFTVASDGEVNGSGATYVNYLFATCPGVSKVGSYTGTGTTKQVDCGFAAGARFVLIKRTDFAGAWYVWDTARGIVSGNDPYSTINTQDVEVTSTDYIDPYSAGFELSSTAPADLNASGGTYIFLAIA